MHSDGVLRLLFMTELAKQIEILLLDNDCVIVPGFGGFMAHHVDSVYVEEEELFLPPMRTLGFNPQLHVNDSLLAQAYVESYDISYPEALRMIEDDTRELRQTLNNIGEFELPNVGIIRVNDAGKYEFTPCTSGILTPELYALNSFDMPLLKGVKSEDKENLSSNLIAETEENVKTEEVIENTIEKDEPKVATIIADDEEDFIEEEESHARIISINTNFVRNIAAVAVVLAVFVLAILPINDGTKHTTLMSSIDTSLLQKIMPQVKVTECEEIAPVKIVNNAVIETKRTNEDIAVTETVKEEISQDTFVVVLASKVSKANGEAYISSLAKKGITDARLIPSGSGNKVVCGAFETESEAYNKANELRSMSSEFADVWVMETSK